MIKVVLDTNLIVSALITPNGRPAQILKFWHEGLFELVVSPQIIEEMRRVLFLERIRRYLSLPDKEIDILLTKFMESKGFIKPQKILKAIKDDPEDDKFIIAALEGGADYIVSGDSHLRDLKMYQGIKIISPADFVKLLGY